MASGNNLISKNAAIAIPLKHLSKFWRSLKMPLINCKIELKLKWTRLCISAAASVENADANSDNIICSIKDTKIIRSCDHFISKK